MHRLKISSNISCKGVTHWRTVVFSPWTLRDLCIFHFQFALFFYFLITEYFIHCDYLNACKQVNSNPHWPQVACTTRTHRKFLIGTTKHCNITQHNSTDVSNRETRGSCYCSLTFKVMVKSWQRKISFFSHSSQGININTWQILTHSKYVLLLFKISSEDPGNMCP